MKIETGTREVQEPAEDGNEVLDQDNSSSELNAVLNTLNNKFQHQYLK